jgi:hypothetical protein
MASPLAGLCVTDVSQKCAGKSGVSKYLCEALWNFEARVCPEAASSFHTHCVQTANGLETSDSVCQWGEAILAPEVQALSSYLKMPGIYQEFVQEWPPLCKELQSTFKTRFGNGEEICNKIENEIVKIAKKL